MDFWLLGGFVGSVDSGEAFYFACSRFFVKPFWIARLADLQRRVDKDFDEVGFAAEESYSNNHKPQLTRLRFFR